MVVGGGMECVLHLPLHVSVEMLKKVKLTFSYVVVH